MSEIQVKILLPPQLGNWGKSLESVVLQLPQL